MNQIQIQIKRRRIEWLTHQNETLQAEVKEYESISDSAIKKSREFSQMQEEICSIANEVHQLGAGLNMISTLSHNIHSLLYLAMMEITKKWTGRRQDWSVIHAQLAVFFADRMPE